MNNVFKAVLAGAIFSTVLVRAETNQTQMTEKTKREALEISSWSITDVTDQYAQNNHHYQDSVSTCSDGIAGDSGTNLNANPDAGSQNNSSGTTVPDTSLFIPNPGPVANNPVGTVGNDPFGPQPTPGGSSGNVWDPVVNPSIGIGGGNLGGGVDPGGALRPDPISRLISLGIAVDVISNMGRRVWDLVHFGKPVSWVNTNSAQGLPKGIKCWTDLEGWSWPVSKVYTVNYKNKLGVSIVDYTYRISYNHGGNIDGIGKYLSNVQIVPVNLKVAWGYAFNSRAEVPTVFNVGSKKDPIAGMQVNVRWKVESSLMTNEQSHMFQIGGNNVFKKVDQ